MFPFQKTKIHKKLHTLVTEEYVHLPSRSGTKIVSPYKAYIDSEFREDQVNPCLTLPPQKPNPKSANPRKSHHIKLKSLQTQPLYIFPK